MSSQIGDHALVIGASMAGVHLPPECSPTATGR